MPLTGFAGVAEPRRLILLFGKPRSGTTWLGKIFDSHPDTLYRHEPDSLRGLSDIPQHISSAEYESYRKEIEEFISRLTSLRSAKICAKLPLFPKSYYSGLRFFFFRLNAIGAKVATRFGAEIPVYSFVNFKTIANLPIAWKSTESLGRLGAIMRLHPNARCIILVRHPCGYVSSILRGEAQRSFTSRLPHAEDWGVFEKLLTTKQAQARGLTISDIKQMNPVERLAWRWLLFNENAMDDTDGIPSCKVVRYEDLCTDPLNVTKQMFDHVGLQWSEQTAGFLARSTAVEDSSYYGVFKNPVESMSKWRKELSQADIGCIMAIVKDSRPGRLFSSDV